MCALQAYLIFRTRSLANRILNNRNFWNLTHRSGNLVRSHKSACAGFDIQTEFGENSKHKEYILFFVFLVYLITNIYENTSFGRLGWMQLFYFSAINEDLRHDCCITRCIQRTEGGWYNNHYFFAAFRRLFTRRNRLVRTLAVRIC